jgi:hypothetical protein
MMSLAGVLPFMGPNRCMVNRLVDSRAGEYCLKLRT